MTPSVSPIDRDRASPYVNDVLITPLQLEKGPLLFNESILAGALDYAPDVAQVRLLPVAGRADLIVEGRGHGQHVEDIRLRAAYHGDFERLLAPRGARPHAAPPATSTSLPPAVRRRRPRRALHHTHVPKSVTMRRAVSRLKMSCANRCFSPCPPARSAKETARDFVALWPEPEPRALQLHLLRTGKNPSGGMRLRVGRQDQTPIGSLLFLHLGTPIFGSPWL